MSICGDGKAVRDSRGKPDISRQRATFAAIAPRRAFGKYCLPFKIGFQAAKIVRRSLQTLCEAGSQQDIMRTAELLRESLGAAALRCDMLPDNSARRAREVSLLALSCV